jgi:hypothetical protein
VYRVSIKKGLEHSKQLLEEVLSCKVSSTEGGEDIQKCLKNWGPHTFQDNPLMESFGGQTAVSLVWDSNNKRYHISDWDPKTKCINKLDSDNRYFCNHKLLTKNSFANLLMKEYEKLIKDEKSDPLELECWKNFFIGDCVQKLNVQVGLEFEGIITILFILNR